jgi:hypothetical protein
MSMDDAMLNHHHQAYPCGPRKLEHVHMRTPFLSLPHYFLQVLCALQVALVEEAEEEARLVAEDVVEAL